MIASRSFWGISPCMDDTVKLDARIFSVNQSTWIVVEGKWVWHMSTMGCTAHLAPCVAKDDGLSYRESVVQVAQGVKLPVFLFHCHEELFDAFQCQFITFHENADGVGHKFGGHFQNIVRQSGTQDNDLSSRWKIPVDIINLILEAFIQQFIGFVKYEHLDIPCSQTSPTNHVEDTPWSSRHNVLAIFQLPNILSDRGSTNASVTLYVHIVAQGKDNGLNLSRQFTRRRENKRLRFSDWDIDGLKYRNGKGRRFTRTRLCLGNDVAALDDGKNSSLLDSRRLFKIWTRMC